MNTELIKTNESANNGKTIFLYYNNEVGFYTAYGFSAFLASHVVDPICSFSKDLQMPVALVNPGQILELRRSLIKLQHTEKTFYRFELRNGIGSEAYVRWAESFTR